MREVIDRIKKHGSDDVTVVWIPSHVGVRENEEADAGAKERPPIPAPSSFTSNSAAPLWASS